MIAPLRGFSFFPKASGKHFFFGVVWRGSFGKSYSECGFAGCFREKVGKKVGAVAGIKIKDVL